MAMGAALLADNRAVALVALEGLASTTRLSQHMLFWQRLHSVSDHVWNSSWHNADHGKGFFFPVGGIVIRLASFRGLWLVHGLFQIFAYLLYIAGAGIGLWVRKHSTFDLPPLITSNQMISARRQLLHDPHPIIGIILLVLIFFQPFLGFLHHFMFKKHSRRVVWSYGHIWLGRIIITLGIINGGLGLRLARRAPVAPPSRGAIIGYSVVAGLIWLVYVVSAIVGERKRGRVVMVRETEGHGKEYESSRSREHSREQYA